MFTAAQIDAAAFRIPISQAPARRCVIFVFLVDSAARPNSGYVCTCFLNFVQVTGCLRRALLIRFKLTLSCLLSLSRPHNGHDL